MLVECRSDCSEENIHFRYLMKRAIKIIARIALKRVREMRIINK